VELAAAGIPPERGHFMLNDYFDFSACPQVFDFALAHSFLTRLSPPQGAAGVAAVVRQLRPGGRFYVAAGANDAFDGSSSAMEALERLPRGIRRDSSATRRRQRVV